MTANSMRPRRKSTEEKRIFRTARIEYVEISRITGMDPIAAEFFRHADVTPMKLLNFADWSQLGLEALMLARMPVVIGPASGQGPLGWLANPAVLLAAQMHWPADTLIPVVMLAHQVTKRTRRLIAGGGLFAASSPALSSSLTPSAMHRVLSTMIDEGINPLATSKKMNLELIRK